MNFVTTHWRERVNHYRKRDWSLCGYVCSMNVMSACSRVV